MVGAFIKRYILGVCDNEHGEQYSTIMRYLVPELVTAFILYTLLNAVDALFIAHLRSTSLYAAQGLSSTLVQFVTKAIEGLSVGTVIMCGFYNGRKEYEQAGNAFITAFWVSCFIGAIVAGVLFFGATTIYGWYGVSPKITLYGSEYLRARAIGIFFSCVFFSLIGFLRAVKNTRVPMMFFIIGSVIFIFFDYALIFGSFGLPHLKLLGSAYASAIQYSVMAIGALIYILTNKEYKQYKISFLHGFTRRFSLRLIRLSLPVAFDKATLAFAKMWLIFSIAPLGKVAIASFTVIKDMEQFAFVPAIACAQIVTFLVSNNYGIGDWLGIKNNIKKILLIAFVMVASILLVFALKPAFFMQFFDQKHVFTEFAAAAFPYISVFVFFDLMQLILAAALRGAGKVYTVMLVRLIICTCFFVPYVWVMKTLPIQNLVTHFIIIYISFYIADGLMGLVYGLYIQRFSKQQEAAEITRDASK